ncbi:protein GUCD1 [Zerene cesonia]|uniref:protein GUCD1 n=1 Tax=Zerene cesonia TaxID=33412 RepID=UPI0018E51659|nr:protein GUCD1 [Zerene cesonia]
MDSETDTQTLHFEHNIPQIRQRFSWDCGVACVLMVLGEKQRQYFLDNFSRILREEGISRCTWTIDLCYLLKRFDVTHCIYTVRCDVNPSYKKIHTQVLNRVRKKFQDSVKNGLRLKQKVLSMQQIAQHVINFGPAILLVDIGLLTCNVCKSHTLSSELRLIFGGSYRGHYICVTGVSGNKALYRDPARAHSLCCVALHRLQLARTPLTDYDVILVNCT